MKSVNLALPDRSLFKRYFSIFVFNVIRLILYTFSLQRKKSLLLEYKLKDKSNKFVDRRIGEKNRAMTAEDRVIARFTASRVKAQKVPINFNYKYILF